MVEALVLDLLVQQTVVVDDGLLRFDVKRRVVANALFDFPLFLLDGILLAVPLLLLCGGDGRALDIILDERKLFGVACGSAA